jgi:hypothetical protein
MNLLVIILAVVTIFLLFILSNYFSNSATTLTSTTNLNSINSSIKITSNPNATRYALGVWIYVNSWTNLQEKLIYEYPGKIKLYLDTSSPTLNLSIGSDSQPTSTTITHNFPIQKWTYVNVSIDNTYADLYIDGKLVKSIQLNALQTATNSPSINMGVGNDIMISKFKRWTNPLSPQDVWNEYRKGNGNMIRNFISSYGLDVNLMKNHATAATFTLF